MTITKKFEKIIEAILHLISVDVKGRVTLTRKNFIIVTGLTDKEKIDIERVGREYKLFRTEKNGVTGTAIIA